MYIDTEGSFVIERVVEMAEAAVHHIHTLAGQLPDVDRDKVIAEFTLEQILKNILYYRVHDYVEQIALINLLPKMIMQEYPSVKCIIIDSITFHFRHDFENVSLRTKLLNTMAQNLMAIAERSAIAVVLMNQMTTKVDFQLDSAILVPALGESWGHNCTNRIILYWKEGQRYAYLHKSPNKPGITVPYQVAPEGVR